MRSRSNSGQRLDIYHRTVYQTILKHQNPVTGLLPLSATNSHAWVRDNLYSVMAVWGLAMAYRKNADMDEDRAKAYELEQSVVKLMRGLLRSMMQQVDKLERFKSSQAPGDALHAKYSSRDCCAVVGDHNWGHLQIDATSLFLLTLSQMTASGLQIIFTLDEVAFIQNLVFYIESAYRIPDYGIWERGDKTNHGLPELNASSIGMAKAALEAIDELDLFGARGGPASVIHVLADEAAQCKAVLQSMLPRESNSKEVDSALLSIISFPAFAVDDQTLIDLTRDTIVDKLKGQYGCRRFLRDGYKTAKETEIVYKAHDPSINKDPRRLHYEPWELKIFENIECEWPVFYAYLLLDGVFSGRKEQVTEYRNALDRIMVKSADGINMMPELYTVPADKVEQEYLKPKSQERLPIGQLPHKWGQSMYVLGRLLQDDFLSPGELDPLNRRLVTEPKPDLVVQVALIAEDSLIQEKLLSHGLNVQTLKEISHVRVFPGKLLRELYSNLGKCPKLGLSGRPSAECGLLTTSKLYRMNDEIWAFTPQFLDSTAFYLVLDTEFLLDQFRTDIAYLRTNWQMLGRPTVIITISHWMIDFRQSLHPALAATLKKLQTGYINGTRVLLGYLTDFLSTSCITKLTFLTKQEEGEELAEDGICRMMEDMISPTSIQRHLPSSEVPFRKRRVSQEMRRRSSSVHGIIRRSRSIHIEANDDPGYLPAQGSHLRPSTSNERLTRTSSTALFQTLDCDELVNLLKQTESMHEQADIIHYLYITKGSDWDTQMAGKPGCTIKDLQVELYQKAGKMKKWWLVRHAAGMLKKRVDDLAKATTDILVRQKQLSVGQPSLREMVITSPRNPEETARIIHEACGNDSSTAMLTQELLVYLAMFIRTEPHLFHEMLRIRVGLIIQVMASELARTLKCPGDINSITAGDEASEQLLNLSPFEMKTLLHHILSGKEFGPRTGDSTLHNPGEIITQADRRRSTVDQAMYHNAESLEEALESDRQGQWLRRRRLDGALNRVPVGFYPRIWRLLERSTGIQIDGYFLQQNLTREMTPGELKFALQVESGLNRIPNPEYRQLLVEAMMVLCELAEHDSGKSNLKLDIQVENIVKDAQKIFLEDQIKFDGDATTCCAAQVSKEQTQCNSSKGICQHFYDSAPSGKYGTISYMWRAVANSIELAALDGNLDCAVS